MKISLIVPCYNEIANIQKGVLDRIGDYTSHDAAFHEILVVDDGSSDDSKKVIKERYLPKYPKMKLIENKHGGKAFAIITGIKSAEAPYVMFSDIDLATPLEESKKLIMQAEKGFDIVIGSRSSRRDGAPLVRKIMAVGFITIRNVVIGLHGIRDTQCGFKLFDREAALHILDRLQVFKKRSTVTGSSVSAGFDLEFLYLSRKLGYKLKEVPVIWRHAETKNVNFFRDSLETLADIARIKYYELTGLYDFSPRKLLAYRDQ